MTERFADRDLESVQAIVDALSVAVGRPVLLDDAALVPISYSRQWGVIDGIRSASILARGVPEGVRHALLEQGIAQAQEIMRTSADPALGMAERVCVPVRTQDELLGYIWLLDPHDTLSTDDLEHLWAAAGRVASALQPSGAQSVDHGGLLRRLVSQSAEKRATAADDLRAWSALGGAAVVFIALVGTSESVDPTAVALQAVRRVAAGHAVGGRFFEGAAIVASLHDPVLRTLHHGDVAQWVHAMSPGGLAVGQSEPTGLAELHEAARRARIALRSAQARPEGSRFAAWASLGADRLLAQLPNCWRNDLPPALVQLLDERPVLAATLAAYLEAGGDVRATAEVTILHRSGVYYRLRRIEELTGLDLANGDDRLLAHLALRAHHMSGTLDNPFAQSVPLH